MPRGDLMISNQNRLSIGSVEGSHTVMLARYEEAVIHRVAGLGEDLIIESSREIDDGLRVGDQRSVARYGLVMQPTGLETTIEHESQPGETD